MEAFPLEKIKNIYVGGQEHEKGALNFVPGETDSLPIQGQSWEDSSMNIHLGSIYKKLLTETWEMTEHKKEVIAATCHSMRTNMGKTLLRVF